MSEYDSLKFKVESDGAEETISSLDAILDRLERIKKAASGVKLPGGGSGGSGDGKKPVPIFPNSPDTTAPSSPVADTLTTEATVSIFDRLKEKIPKSLADLKKVTGKGFASYFAKVKENMKPFEKLFDRIGRTITTMAIRAAIKEIAAGISEGTQNVYQWSKSVNGDFAAAMDTLATKSFTVKNSIGALASSIIQVAAPAIEALANLAIRAVNAINQLFAAITGASSWTRAIEQQQEYAKAAGASTAAVKELKKTILGFDEINKMNSPTSAGGGGGASAADFTGMFEKAPLSDFFSDLQSRVQENMTKLNAMLGAFEIGVGLVFLAFGHPLIGLGLMIDGVRREYQSLPDVFSQLESDTGSRMSGIKDIFLGPGLLAVGGILLALGQPALGLGLMVAGGLETFSSVMGTIGWDIMPENVRDTLARVAFYVGGITFTLGVIALCLGQYALGIGLMIAGVSVVASLVAPNVGAMSESTEKELRTVGKIIGGVLFAIGVIALCAGQIPMGVGLMAAGVTSVAAAISPEWGAIEDPVYHVLDSIENYFEGMVDKLRGSWDSLVDKIKNSGVGQFVSNIYNKITGSSPYTGSHYASGGFPTEGQMFIAREAGPELVGTIGGHTAVANNDQIISGIRQGVADANTESNSLLREQNNLLRQILAKEGNTTITTQQITEAFDRKTVRDGKPSLILG